MKQLVVFKLESGGEFFAEVEAREPLAGIERAALADAVVAQATGTFESAVAKIGPIASAVITQLRAIEGPTGIEVAFGIKFSAAAGVVLAAATTEASIGVKLSWTPKRQ